MRRLGIESERDECVHFGRAGEEENRYDLPATLYEKTLGHRGKMRRRSTRLCEEGRRNKMVTNTWITNEVHRRRMVGESEEGPVFALASFPFSFAFSPRNKVAGMTSVLAE